MLCTGFLQLWWARASHHGGFSYCVTWALSAQASIAVTQGLSSCGSWALECRLSSGAQAWLPCDIWNLSGAGISSIYCALTSGFLTTEPPSKSCFKTFLVWYNYTSFLFIFMEFLFLPLTFSLYVYLLLKLVSCRQHINGSCYLIHLPILYLLIGAFSPFTFKIIINKHALIAIAILLISFCFPPHNSSLFISSSHSLFPHGLMPFFSVKFRCFTLFLFYISFCSYCEIHI